MTAITGRTKSKSASFCEKLGRPTPPIATRRDIYLRSGRYHDSRGSSRTDLTRLVLISTAVIQVLVKSFSVYRTGTFRISKYSSKPKTVQISSSGRLLTEIDHSQYEIEPHHKFSISPDPKEWWVDPNHNNYDECVWMYDWQTRTYPTCNIIHESGYSRVDDRFKFIDSGMVRDVFDMTEWDGTRWALKVLRYANKYNEYHMMAQIKDSVVAERLSSSPYVASMFGMCGFSSLYEFASEGTLQTHYKDMSKSERLVAAVQVSRALADVHTLGGGEYSPIAHADIADRQFIKLHGHYQLNDFNCAFLLKWNTTSNNRSCKIRKEQFITRNRSPEEIRDKWCWIDEKVDIYSVGNLYYQLLTNRHKYGQMDTDEAAELILAGDIPKLPDHLEKSTHIADVALKEAMLMSIALEPENRATAKQVADYLQEQLENYEEQRSGKKRRTTKQHNGK